MGERGEGGGKFPCLSACLAAASLEPGSRPSRGFPRRWILPPLLRVAQRPPAPGFQLLSGRWFRPSV